MRQNTRVVYLHGFASSPQAHKAREIAESLTARGIRLERPDLNLPSFERLSLRAQRDHVESMLANDDRPTVLIGSSMGGYLATLIASTHARPIAALLLLAPAFDLAARWVARMDPATLAQWRDQGTMPYYHYGHGRELPMHHDFLEEAATLPAMPGTSARVTVVQGRRDPTVSHTQTRAWVDQNPQAKLVELDDDHALIASLPVIRAELDTLLDELQTGSSTPEDG